VVEAGTIATRVSLLFAPGAPPPVGPARSGEVVWGAPEFAYLAPGVRLGAAGLDLSGLDICELLAVGSAAGGAACPGGIEKLELKTAFLDFDPTLDFSATYSGFSLQSFRGVVDGTLDLRFTGVLEAETSTTLVKQFEIVDVTRPFWLQIGAVPVIGYVDLTLHAGLEVKATAKGSIEAGFTNLHSVQVGATYAAATGWQGVFQSQRTFDATEPSLGEGTLSGQIDLETKLSFKPEFKIIFYGVIGPFANVEPYGQTTITFGTSSCGFDSKAGVDSEIGFTIPFLDESVSDFAAQQQLGTWQGKTWTCPLGTLDVATTTNGQDPDPDGYDVVVDSVSKGHVGATAQKTVPFIQVGARQVELKGVSNNCTVQGANPQSVNVVLAGIHPVQFTVQCAARTGDLEVSVLTIGDNLDPDGYTVTLNGTQNQAIGINGQVAFSGLGQGTYSVALGHLASNCAVNGPNPQLVALAPGAPARVRFDVVCTAGEIIVQVKTTGPPATSDWLVTLDGTVNKPIGPNGAALFVVTDGSYAIELENIASNCSVQGANPRTVQVQGSTPVTVTFDVTCTGAGLTVTVQTTGDSIPTTPYTVRVDNAQSQTVAVNGTVNFSNVAQGTHSVLLDDVPAHCVVFGINPRAVDSPGATTFEVLCQRPTSCTLPPPAPELYSRTGRTPRDGGTVNTQIIRSQWHDHAVSASATAPGTGLSDEVSAESGSLDYMFFVPVDPSRAGEGGMTLIYHVTGRADASGETHASSGMVTAVAIAHAYPRSWQAESYNQSSVSITVDENVAYGPFSLGRWVNWGVYASADAKSRNGQTSTAQASIKVDRLIEVRDFAGNVVPILKVCTASGTQY
jgi:hypothetical protein